MLFNSTGVDSQRLLPASLEDQIVGLMGRMLGFGMLAVLALVWTSVLSWSVTDPSLTHATGGETRNLLGPLGAIVSDLLLQTFGYAATIALLPPMLWGLELAVAERVQGFRAKIAFFPLAVLMLAGALSSLPTFTGWPLHHGYGGLLGDAVLRLATSVLAVVNPDRAGIAAGLVLLAAGLSAISYSIGVELREIWSLTRGVPRSLRLGSWRRAFGERTTLPADSRYLAGSDASMQPQGYPAMAGPPTYASIGEHGGHPGWHGGYPGPQPTTYVISPTLQNPYAEYEEPAAGYMPAAEAGRPVASWTPPRSGGHAPYPVHEPAGGYVGMAASAAAPTHGSSDGPDVVRDMEFDLATDDSSRWIAERFAPGAPAGVPESRVPHPAAGRGTPTQPQLPMPQGPIPSSSPPPQPSPQAQAQPPSQPAAQPAPGRARSGLIGGVGFRKPAPTTKRPSLNLLKRPTAARPGPELTQTVLRGNARLLEDVLADFGIKGEVRDIRPGPVVTLYEVEPARGTKSSRVISLADDIARSMSAAAVRVAVVPGRNAIGIEL
ncbi:MAG: DNA translocase FtsK 4TM domain-containing protein, partial [Pseudomonadota bacterium]